MTKQQAEAKKAEIIKGMAAMSIKNLRALWDETEKKDKRSKDWAATAEVRGWIVDALFIKEPEHMDYFFGDDSKEQDLFFFAR